jgi:hypothetical protein
MLNLVRVTWPSLNLFENTLPILVQYYWLWALILDHKLHETSLYHLRHEITDDAEAEKKGYKKEFPCQAGQPSLSCYTILKFLCRVTMLAAIEE